MQGDEDLVVTTSLAQESLKTANCPNGDGKLTASDDPALAGCFVCPQCGFTYCGAPVWRDYGVML